MNRYYKVILMYVLSQSVFVRILFNLFNQPFFNLTEELKLIFVNLVLNIGLIGVSFLFLKEELIREVRTFKGGRYFVRMLLMGSGLTLVTNVVSQFILISLGDGSTESMNQQLVVDLIEVHPVVMFVMATMLAPIAEELVFRFSVMNLIQKPVPAVIVSSLFFGWVHVAAGGDYLYMIPYVLSGLILSVSYLKSNNIWYPIAIHVVNNLLATLIQLN